ncbi:MAG: hypothetical protein PHN72_03230 [Bacilli bacterium]|nr:hypothetical protein [Bacilli bacterium]
MKILLFGDHSKYQALIQYLEGKDYKVSTPTNMDEEISSYDLVIFPQSQSLQNIVLDTNTILTNITSNTGKYTLRDLEHYYIENLVIEKKLYPSFLQEPELVKDGIVADLIVNKNIMNEIPEIVILGYQNLGRKVTFALQSLGLGVKVGVDNRKDKEMLKWYGVNPFYLESEERADFVKSADIIINTLSDYQIEDKEFSQMKKGAYIIDSSIYPPQASSFYENAVVSYKKVYAGLSDTINHMNPAKVLTVKIQKS